MIYYRASKNSNGIEWRPYYMFTKDYNLINNGLYGNYIFITTDTNAISISDLIPTIAQSIWSKRRRLLFDTLKLKYKNEKEILEKEALNIALAANLPDIVNSGGLWDHVILGEFVRDNILRPLNIMKIKTIDGLILFFAEDMTFLGMRSDINYLIKQYETKESEIKGGSNGFNREEQSNHLL